MKSLEFKGKLEKTDMGAILSGVVEGKYFGAELGCIGADILYRLQDALKVPEVPYERASWKVKHTYDGAEHPQFIYWGGATHILKDLIDDGWEVEVKHNRFTNRYRLICTIPYSAGGKLYSQSYEAGLSEVVMTTFIPNKLTKNERKNIREVLGTDLEEVSTLKLMEILEERLKAETPVTKTPKKLNPKVLDMLEFLKQFGPAPELKEAVNEY